jgi:hypothetical protein
MTTTSMFLAWRGSACRSMPRPRGTFHGWRSLGCPAARCSPLPASVCGRVGGRHAFIYGGQPDCANLGYILDEAIYHPGDSLYVPEQPVETLLVPAQGSWMKMAEAIDFVRAIRPQRAFAIHDAQLNDRGLASVNGWLAEETDNGYRYLAPGESV